MAARREKMPPTTLNLPARHSLTPLEQIVYEVGSVMPLTPPTTPDVTPLPLFPITETKTPENDPGLSENNSIKSVEKKRFTVIEPAVFLVYVATALAGAVLQNQQLYQTCVAVYNYDKELCEPMLGVIAKNETSKEIETKVQPYVANIIMTSSVISSVLPAFLSLFIGPWSDKFGRRPVLVATFSAALMGHSITTILAAISMATPVNPWIYIISNIPLALTGGTCALITMVFCLVSDVSDEGGKARRMFFVDGALGIGTLVGNVISSYILAGTGTIGVFAIAAGMDLLALLYLLFFVSESLKLKHERKESKLREFFHFDLIKDLVRSCLKRRPHYDRAIIWCIMFTLVTTTFVMQGEANVFYLFLRNKFNLTLQEFTTYNAITICIKMVGCGLILVLLRVVFKAPLITVAMLGLLGCFTDSLIRSLAQQFWQMYLAATCGFMGGINSPMLQAVLAGLVEATEIGKVYAVISSLQTLSPLASAPVYTGIYRATLESYPGAFYFLSASIYLVCFVLITCLFVMQRIGAKAARQPSAP
ncbi:tetracycline resistance protein, class A isoform X1 [Zeugodacus cucurbitae]|uniref:tetracycline resistance protein, class A isoform X1 n=1 Tax=Zeugodacus cucurbitae TaxID=28588 RepID=UPI0023D91920|nr:tetracycline resistance protein, class A isoform X1 [Zeugodacus cucurbitae]